MVKAKDINKDIKSISEKVGTAVFSYDEIFNSKVDNEFHYDYKKVIDEYARVKGISAKESENKLTEIGILKPLPNNEYKIEVGESTRGGGGINFHGEAFFSYDQKNYRTKYHELAHSLQRTYNLFDNDKIQQQYDISQKGLSEEQKNDLLVGRGDYALYLNEMHSESFSYAAMMLRASNSFDFVRQMHAAYNSGTIRNANAVTSTGKPVYGDGNNNSKFYATRPVMKATIKAIWKIRKEGKTGEFFDKNGVIKDEKLAKLCENIVLESAYSPRTLNSFFKNKILDKHNKEEHGWRLDALKSVVQAPTASIVSLLHEGNTFQMLRKKTEHAILDKINKKKMNNYINKPNKCKDPEMQALKEYERLQYKLTQLDNKFPDDFLSYNLNKIMPTIANHNLPTCMLKNMTNSMKPSHASSVYKELSGFQDIIKNNYTNPYFKQLLKAQPEISTLRTLINDKQKNPDKNVIDGAKLNTEQSSSLTAYPFLTKMTLRRLDEFAKDNNLSPELQQSMYNMLLHNPEALKLSTTRKNWMKEHQKQTPLKGFKKRKFEKTLNKLADSLYAFNYKNQDNPKFQNIMAELKKIPPEKNSFSNGLEKVTNMANIDMQNKINLDNSLLKMEEALEQKGEAYNCATIEAVKAFAKYDKNDRNRFLNNEIPEMQETLKPLLAQLPEKAMTDAEIANIQFISPKQAQQLVSEKQANTQEMANISNEVQNSTSLHNVSENSGVDGKTETLESKNLPNSVNQSDLTSATVVNKSEEQTNVTDVKQNIAPQQTTAVNTSVNTQESVTNMQDKEKGKFFHKLRMGINMFLSKTENKQTVDKTLSQTNTQTHQPSMLQHKMRKDKGLSM